LGKNTQAILEDICAPSSSEIVERIGKLFTMLDEKDTMSLCLFHSKAKSAICLVEQAVVR